MTHWFLCARDVMWLCVMLFPLTASFLAASPDEPDLLANRFFIAVVSQVVLVTCLYEGVIR